MHDVVKVSSKDTSTPLLDRLKRLEQAVYEHDSPRRSKQSYFPKPEQVASASSMGLLGFGVASIVSGALKISNDGSAGSNGLFASTAFFLGGLAQFVTALNQISLNDPHSAAAFGVYGMHWMGTGVLLLTNSLSDTSPPAQNPSATVAYNLSFVFVTIILCVPTFRMNAIVNATFIALALVFALDIPSSYGYRKSQVASGIIQCLAGLLGLYSVLVEFTNETWGRNLLPTWPYKTGERDLDIRTVLPHLQKGACRKSFHLEDWSGELPVTH